MAENREQLEYAGVGVKSAKRDTTAGVSLAFALILVGVILLTAGVCGWPPERGMVGFVWPVCAVGAGVFGVGYVWAKRRREAGRPLWWQARVGCLGMVALVLVGAGIMAVGMDQAYERMYRVNCASNLRQIGQGIMLYANDNKGAFPPDLGTLVVKADLSPELFACISTMTEVPEEIRRPEGEAKLAAAGKWVNEHSDYVYVGAGMTDPVSANVVVAYEKPANHRGAGMNVLLGDGAVQWVNKGQMASVLADLKAGVNPPKVFVSATTRATTGPTTRGGE